MTLRPRFRRAFVVDPDGSLDAEALRANHNFAPDSSISVVVAALRRHVDPELFEQRLALLPPEARAFWTP